MAELNLDLDEGVILETEGVHRSGNGSKNSYIKKMLLTNKNIIYVTSQKTRGLFSKSVDMVDKVPLSNVKVINGQVLATQKKTDLFEYALQIQFVNGIEEYSYSEGSKKISNQWVNELNKLLGNGQPVMPQGSSMKNEFFNGLSGLASNFGSMAGTLGQSVSSAAKQAVDQAGISYGNAKAQTEEKRQKQEQEEATFQHAFSHQTTPPTASQATGGFCVNCGAKLDSGAKFCSRCGAAVGSFAHSLNVPPIPTVAPSNPITRQQEYAGTVLKCPNCGAVISQTTAVCPECGHRITGQVAVSSVRAFSDKLMLLESKRKGAGLGQIFGVSADPIDTQKLSLIRSFPIPNTIDDIQEFMLLAIANIDVGLSKNTLNNRYQSKMKSAESSLTMPRTISDAWVAKMKQAYQKAAVSFPNDPAFSYVRQLYIDKMTELKMKLEE